MSKQKNFLLLAIMAGAVGVIIGGITLFLSIADTAKP